jgi:hypothetical protein
MAEKCPCCGWRDGLKTPYTVNTDTSMIYHNGEGVKVAPLEAKLAAACALTYPHPIHTGAPVLLSLGRRGVRALL